MNDNFQKVKDAINLADYVGRYATLKRAGNAMKCLCPLPGHQEKSPSFEVKEDHWQCWGKCSTGGDIFDFYRLMNGGTEHEALVALAGEYSITLEALSPAYREKQDKRERLYALMAHAAQFFHKHLYDNDEALDYLCGTRKLSLETIDYALMGYAPAEWQRLSVYLKVCGYTEDEMLAAGMAKRNDEGKLFDTFRSRIMIPVRDERGRIVAFSGRAMQATQTPKYFHNATNEIFEKSKIVHRMPRNRSTMPLDATDTTLIVVEGTIDPVSGLNHGFYNIASIMGVSLSDDQLTLLCKGDVERLVFCLDNDSAGNAALRRLVEKHMHAAAEHGVDLYAMAVPYGKDADDTLREHVELWEPAVNAARPVVDVLLERESVSLAMNATAAQKQSWAVRLLPLLRGSNGFVNTDNANKLAAYLGYPVPVVQAWALSQAQVLPRQINTPARIQHRSNWPTLELTVLHGILTNDLQMWVNRANEILGKMPYKTACEPLSMNDFTDTDTRGLMAVICRAMATPRPFDDEIETQIGHGPLNEIYTRAIGVPETQAIFATHDQRPAYNLTFDAFLRACYRLRALRLKRDVDTRAIADADLVEWVQARMHLERLAHRVGV